MTVVETLQTARKRPQRTSRAVRNVIALTIVLVAAVALWPAKLGGFTGLVAVQGQSMEPTYDSGDLAVVLRQGEYAVGDIVSFVVPRDQPGAGARVIHRIISADVADGTPRYLTQGDNSPAPDMWEIGPGDITGRAVTHIPRVGGLLTGKGYPLLQGAIVGIVVTVLLWPVRRTRDVSRS